jgi:phenylacetate-CoA ligase
MKINMSFNGENRIRAIDILRGTKILTSLNNLRHEQFMSSDILSEKNITKKLIKFNQAKIESKYYENFFSYDDIPILTKETIKNNIEALKSKTFKGDLIEKATGGSTGDPLTYLTTKNAQSFMWAGILLSWETAGYKIGDKVAFLAGISIIKKSIQHKIFHKLLNVKTYSTYNLTDENIKIYIEEIKHKKIKLIYGYATAIGKMASYIIDHEKIDFPDLKSIVTTAEILTQKDRENIKNAFNVDVYNQYGCNEAGISAFECEFKNMHLINSGCSIEIDDEDNLITTNLVNDGFFLLRYFTGDKIKLSNRQTCQCGRGYPIIEDIKGRSYDFVVDSNQKSLHAAFFNILFREEKSIDLFQVEFDKTSITIFLKVNQHKNDPNYFSKYLDLIKENLFFNEYNLILDAPFQQAKNAKHRYVIDKSMA